MAGLIFKLYDGVHTALDLADHGGNDFFLGLSNALAFPPSEQYNLQIDQDTGMAVKTHIVSGGDGPREVRCPVRVRGTPDGAQNLAQDINRWLQQGIRANRNENAAHPVYLYIQRPGAANATIHRIIYGTFDEGSSVLSSFTQTTDSTSTKIMGMLNLILYPTGTTVSPIKMNNIAVGAPAMERWESGIPHGWNKINGAETVARLQDQAYIGPYLMQVTVDTDDYGVYTDFSELTTVYELLRAMVHINVSSGTWLIRLESSSGAVVSESGITNANQASLATDTVESRNGDTWYIFDLAQLSANLQTQDQYRLRFRCTTSPGTILIDSYQIEDVKPINLTANPGMDDPVNTGSRVAGWEGSADSLVVWGTDGSNYATSPAAATVTFSQTASDSTTYFRQVIAQPFVQNHEYFGQVSVRILGAHGGQTVKLALWDGADNELDSVEFDGTTLASVATTSYTGDDAATYYILNVSGTNADAPGVRLIFHPTSTGTADINLIIDEAYLLTEEGPQFSQAYISKTGLLYPRNDYLSGEAANEDYVDNFRLANVPGNRPALVNMYIKLLSAATTDRTFYISRFTEEKNPAIEHQIEGEDFATGSGSWASHNDADWTEEYANQFTSAGSEGYVEYAFPANALSDWYLRSLGSVERLVFARCETDSASPTAAYVRFALTHHFDQLILQNEKAYFNDTSTTEFLYLGPLNLTFSEAGWNFNRLEARARVYAFAENTKKVWFDNLIILAAEDGGWMSFHVPELAQAELLVIDSVRGEVVRASESIAMQKHRGTKRLTALPGNISSQFIVGHFEGSTLIHDIDETFEITVEIWPQTTTLLGTK